YLRVRGGTLLPDLFLRAQDVTDSTRRRALGRPTQFRTPKTARSAPILAPWRADAMSDASGVSPRNCPLVQSLFYRTLYTFVRDPPWVIQRLVRTCRLQA